MPLVATAVAGMTEAVRCEVDLVCVGEAHIQALRSVVSTYDGAMGRFSAQTISSAAAYVVLELANARREGFSVER